MKIYEKRPKRIAAVMIDFSTPDKTWETMQALDRCSHILIHENGDRDYRVRLYNDKEGNEYMYGDYICRDLDTYEWYGMRRYDFEEGWNEVD